MSPVSGSLLAEPSKSTSRGKGPDVGFAVDVGGRGPVGAAGIGDAVYFPSATSALPP